jgi:multiple sugar transport system substrate-binding protein
MFGAANAGSNQFFQGRRAPRTFSEPGWVGGLQVPDRHLQGRPRPEGQRELGLQRNRRRVLFRHLRHARPGSGRADRHRRADERRGLRRRSDAEGADGKSFPTIGYAGWAMFADSERKEESWKLIAHLSSPESNITWNKRIGALPIYTAAEKDEFYGQPKFAGWFEELGDPNVQPTSMPTYLEEFGFFADSVVPRTSQEALLGQPRLRTCQGMGRTT